MKVDGYIRVSRVAGREGESFISPDVQRKTIERLAKAKGLQLGEVVEELDVSGGKRPEDRELGRLIEKVERGESGGLVVWKASRFARSLVDGVVAAHRVTSAGGRFVAEDVDSAQPMGKALLGLMFGLAEEELDARREGWNQARERAVNRGVHVASRAPTGYRRRKDGVLEKDEHAAPVVREVFLRRATGTSWRNLAALLREANVRGPYGSKEWTTSAVSKLVANPVYTGEARSGEHRNPNAHDHIVTVNEWRAAQGARGEATTKSGGEGALLSGLLRCAGCRYLMKPDTMRQRNGEQLRFYRCRGEHAAGKCPAPSSVLGRVIEPYLEEQFLTALGPDGPLAHATQSNQDVQAAEGNLADAEADLGAWLELSIPDLGADTYAQGLSIRQRKVDEAREVLQTALTAAAGPLANVPSTVNLGEVWSDLGVAERRQLLTAGFDAVMLFQGREQVGDRVELFFNGTAPSDLPRRGHRVPLRSYERPVNAGVAVAKDGKERKPNRTQSRRRKVAAAA